MIKFPDKKYNIIYADPPWKYSDSRDYKTKNNPSGSGGAVKHYQVMTKEELMKLPVSNIADDNCMLLMWVTFPKLDWGIDVLSAWGFTFCTVPFVWIKMKNDMTEPRKDGIGSYTNNNAEIILLGRKGKYWRESKKVHQVIQSPKMEHSKKPEEARNRIEQLFGDVPRIELFARKKIIGWDAWGDEID